MQLILVLVVFGKIALHGNGSLRLQSLVLTSLILQEPTRLDVIRFAKKKALAVLCPTVDVFELDQDAISVGLEILVGRHRYVPCGFAGDYK